jgi:hypothetical protein
MRLRLLIPAAVLAVAATACGSAPAAPAALGPVDVVRAYYATRVPIQIGEVSYDPNGGNRALVTRVGHGWGAWSATEGCTGGTDNTNPRDGQVDGGYASSPGDFDQAYSEAGPSGSYFDAAIPLNRYSGVWTIACAR